MGNRLNGQGQGRNTSNKESAFGVCESYHLNLEARFLLSLKRPVPYFHLDLNAGCGRNDAAGVVGTPMMFLNRARKYPQLPVRAWFIEKHRQRALQLRNRLTASGLLNGHLFGLERAFEVRCEDNALALGRLLDDVQRYDRPEYARGCVISDPNGWSPREGALDLDAASAVLALVPHFMLLVCFFWGRAKAMRGYVARGESGPIKNVAVRRVSDYLHLRPHWLISEPSGQYCYLCGTCRPYKEWTRPDGWRLVSVASPRGQELLRYYDEIQEMAVA